MDQAPAFMFCPRCGKQNGVSRTDCWSCRLAFHASMKPGAEAVDDQENLDDLEYFSDPSRALATPTVSMEETVRQVPPMGEETVRQTTTPPEPYVKFRCTTCRKKFSIVESRLAKIQKCPGCGVRPFVHAPP